MATLTITTTAQQDARIAEAVGRYLDLTDGNGAPRSATGPEVKAVIIDSLKRLVLNYERSKAIESLTTSPLDIT